MMCSRGGTGIIMIIEMNTMPVQKKRSPLGFNAAIVIDKNLPLDNYCMIHLATTYSTLVLLARPSSRGKGSGWSAYDPAIREGNIPFGFLSTNYNCCARHHNNGVFAKHCWWGTR